MKQTVHLFWLFCLMLPGLLNAQQHEPDIRWQTIETEHFSIHFPDSHRRTALLVAGLCEQVYDSITTALNFRPGRTEVILHTRTPLSNGFVAPMPWRMELMITEPQENWMGSRDSWLRLLITHEFTHIVHLRKRRGLSRLTRPFLGDLNAFWQALTPNWFIEGFPTYTETIFNRGGRGRNAYHRMFMQAPVYAGKPWRLENTNYLSRKTNPAYKLYVSGYFLSEYVAAVYGPDAWRKILDRYSAWPIFGFNRAVKKITGKSMDALYRDMVGELGKQGIHLPAASETPYSYYSPRWIDATSLVALKVSFDALPAFVRIDAQGREKILFERLPGQRENGFSLVGDRLIWTENIPHPRFSATSYFELRSFDLSSGSRRALTTETRLQSPDISRDGRRIVAVEYDAPVSRLVSLDLHSGKREILQQDSSAVLLTPRWSPTGRHIALARKDADGWQDIVIFDTKNRSWRYASDRDEAHDSNPEWSADGRMLYFVSDRSGRFNIWAVELATGRRWMVTDEPLGAFSPAASPDGQRLIFTRYTYSGFRLKTITLLPELWRPEEDVAVRRPGPPIAIADSAGTRRPPLPAIRKEGAYSPFGKMLRPQGWLPVFIEDMDAGAVGLGAFAEDALHRHNWNGFAALSLEPERLLVYDLQYSYSRWWPMVTARTYAQAAPVQARINGEVQKLWWRRQGQELRLALPLTLEQNVRTQSLQTSLSLVVENISSIRGPYRPHLTRYAGVTADVFYNRFSGTLRDVAPQSSWLTYALFEKGIEAFENAYSSQRMLVYNQVFLPTLFPHHQLELLALFQDLRGNYPYQLSFSIKPAGYDDSVNTPRSIRLKAGYHFPLFYIERGIPLLPIFLDYLAGEFFYDFGTGWQGRFSSSEWRQNSLSSFGVRLRVRSYLFQVQPVQFNLVLAFRPEDGKAVVLPEISIPLPFLNRPFLWKNKPFF